MPIEEQNYNSKAVFYEYTFDGRLASKRVVYYNVDPQDDTRIDFNSLESRSARAALLADGGVNR